MATIGDIRDALQVRLDTIAGLNTYDKWPPAPVTPAAWPHYIGPVAGAYATIGGDSYDEFEIVVLITSGAGSSEAQDALDGYVSRSGANSVQVAIEGDQTLADAVDFAQWAGWTEYGEGIEIGDQQFYGARGRVLVWH